jgi:L-serine dehydratase
MTIPSKYCSILNDILGPVMRGPSSSHSAAPYAIARICRQLSLSNGEGIRNAVVRFDSGGSFSQVHTEQGSDEGFTAGFMGIDMVSPEYLGALNALTSPGAPFGFRIEICSLKQINHPNLVEILLTCSSTAQERTDQYLAVSIGAGAFRILRCNTRPIDIDGRAFTLIIECNEPVSGQAILGHLGVEDLFIDELQGSTRAKDLWQFNTRRRLRPEERERFSHLSSVIWIREAAPSQLLIVGTEPLFRSGKDVLALCSQSTLPEIADRYESMISGLPVKTMDEIFAQRTQLLLNIAEEDLARNAEGIQYKFLQPTARKIFNSQSAKGVTGEAIHFAICGALTVMKTSIMRGVVCACPTARSAGILPGCLYSLKQSGYSLDSLTDALKVAGLIGVIIGIRGTFAAELAGCMVETGAAAAMAAAGIAYAANASPEDVFNAATICLMNTLGLVCDPIGGEVEVPCHARNISGVGHAFVAASSALGGFNSFVPFDEVVDTTLKIGECLPGDLRCTSRGGLAATPTALSLSGRAGTKV